MTGLNHVEFDRIREQDLFKRGIIELSRLMVAQRIEGSFGVYRKPGGFGISRVIEGAVPEVSIGRLTETDGVVRDDIVMLIHSHRLSPGDSVARSSLPSAIDAKDYPRLQARNNGLIEGVLSVGLGSAALFVFRDAMDGSFDPAPLLRLKDTDEWPAVHLAMRRANLRTQSLAFDPQTGECLSHSYAIEQFFR